MKTIREQFQEQGVTHSMEGPRNKRRDQTVESAGHGNTKKGISPVLRLPMFGKVDSIRDGRGFGFLRAAGLGKDIFFHVYGRLRWPKHEGRTLPSDGETVCFVLGIDPHKPERTSAVCWARIGDLRWPEGNTPHNQAQLDEIRKALLAQQSLDPLWILTHAHWYRQKWQKPRPVPAGLEDPILGEVLWHRLSQISEDSLESEGLGAKLARGLYDFCTLDSGLDVCSPGQLAALGSPEARWMQRSDPEEKPKLLEWYLLSGATIDEEKDWQPWFSGQWDFEANLAEKYISNGLVANEFTCQWIKALLEAGTLSPQQVETWALSDSLAAASLFDYLPQSRRTDCLDLWRNNSSALDTLLKDDPTRAIDLIEQFALAVDLETDGSEIWEIGSARHGQGELLYSEHNGSDLSVAMASLKNQIDNAGLLVGHNILAWDWPILQQHLATESMPLIWDTLLVQFLLEPQGVSHALDGNHHADGDAIATLDLLAKQLRKMPPAVTRLLLCGEFDGNGNLLDFIAQQVLTDVQLVRQMPKAFRLSAGESIPVTVLAEARIHELDWVPGAVVISANTDENLSESLLQLDAGKFEENLTAELSLEPAAVILLAVARVAERQSVSLRRNMIPSWLVRQDSSLASAVQAACVVPDTTGNRCFAPFPAKLNWWRNLDASQHRVVLPNQTVVLDRRETAPRELVEKATEHSRANLVKLATEEDGNSWLCVDRPASMLSQRGGWRSFGTFALQEEQIFPGGDAPSSTAKPVFCIRNAPALYPNTMDQDVYWVEVLCTFREIIGKQEHCTPILLVASTHNRQLINSARDGLVASGICENWPEHHSRRSYLLGASRKGLGLVDHLDDWRSWQLLAQDTGVSLLPVVEALPLEEWHALSATEFSKGSDQPGSTGQQGDESDRDTIRIAPARILENLTQLITSNVASWLLDMGFTVPVQSVWVMDPRIASREAALARCGDFVALDSPDLPEQQLSVLRGSFLEFCVDREDAPSDYASMEQFLVKNWQGTKKDEKNPIRGFKKSQKEAMEAICDRSSDVLVALPTGEGKSVLFQVPALARGLRNRRLTLVISPLKALMHDQVQALERLGFAESVEYLSSDRPRFEITDALQGVLDHRVVLLYVAPERLRSKPFVDVLHKRAMTDGGLEYVVVDETHCVNQWGYEFRPDYFYAIELLLRRYRAVEDDVTPFLLFSATVTASDKDRLKNILARQESGESVLPFALRPETSPFPLGSHISIKPQRAHGRINSRDELGKALESRFPHIQTVVHEAMANRQSTGQRSAVVIFVSRRDHAESLAAKLMQETNVTADFYHAGLDSDTRTEVYTQFKSGEIDILVATKAFGMGMDIPDIHWAIHLSPPTYLEDYLQEVGRIGRGEAERKQAGLEQLEATLLFSPADFENNRSQRASGALQRHNVEELDSEIRKHTATIDGQSIAILPEAGFEPPKEWWLRDARVNQIRLALYWLERAGRIDICARVPDLVSVTIESRALERIVNEGGELGEAAKLILGMHVAESEAPVCVGSQSSSVLRKSDETVVPNERRSEGWLGGLLSRLGDMVGMLFHAGSQTRTSVSGAPVKPAPVFTRRPDEDAKPGAWGPGCEQGVLNLRQLMLRLGFTQQGQVMACIVDISKRGGLTIDEQVRFATRPLADEPPGHIEVLFGAVEAAVEELARQLGKGSHNVRFLPEELVEDRPSLKVDEKLRPQYERAYVNGMRTLARASGIRLKQVVDQQGNVRWDARMPAPKRFKNNKERIVRNARALFYTLTHMGSRADSHVSVDKLVRAVRDTRGKHPFHFRDLENAQRLLSSMKLFSFSSELLSVSYVLAVNEVNESWDELEALWTELQEVNNLAEVRCQAMEVFANLPVEAQHQFITEYFRQADSEQLNEFLESQLGEVDAETNDENLSEFIVEKRQQLRATEIKKHFERYQESEEPNQWEVIRQPWDRHVLVNAGPGAGKTAVLVARIAHLINKQNIRPREIIVLAFNRAVVFEIKKRLKDLFLTIGYAAYVGRLRVSTFHSLAIQNLGEPDDRDRVGGDDDDLLKAFANRLAGKENFRRSVVGDCRCILMDEFQDATQDIYDILRQLYLGRQSSMGMTVIGDDDQDILRWNRLRTGGAEFSEAYFKRFQKDFGHDRMAHIELRVNFRSDSKIVERSQQMIGKFIEHNDQSNRLKISKLRSRGEAASGDVQGRKWRGKKWSQALESAIELRNESWMSGSLAILCRTNAEVAEAYGVLSSRLNDLRVQGRANLAVRRLRHVALWLEFLEERINEQDALLTDELKSELFRLFGNKFVIPETLRASHYSAFGVDLEEIWEFCAQESRYPHLSDLLNFILGLRTDDMERLRGDGHDSNDTVISTIHKVKGLEFDGVVVLPSRHGFGVDKDRQRKLLTEIKKDAAEEARLQYVAMTRAKNRLFLFAGDRELAWAEDARRPQAYKGKGGDGLWLAGSPEDVFLSWSMQYSQYNRNPETSQTYIEQQVRVRDEIILGGYSGGAGKALMHRGSSGALRQIGFLSNKSGRGESAAELTVSAVVRQKPSEDRPDKPLAQSVRQRGWGYTVLVSGRLR